MKWITRANVKVDRVACPWLIRTFIDREAEFLFVPVEQVESTARKTGAIPYDVAGVELGHHGEECSFDAIINRYGLAEKEPALKRLALIVRGADTDQRDLTPESRGLVAIAQGFSLAYDNDQQQLAAELPVYDALFAWCKQQDGR